MYDLRFCKLPPVNNHKVPSDFVTLPYLSYPDYCNSWDLHHQMDISVGLGLIAHATRDQKIQIFQLWTGREVQRLQASADLRSLKFAGDKGPALDVHDWGRTVLLEGGNNIREWRLRGESDDGEETEEDGEEDDEDGNDGNGEDRRMPEDDDCGIKHMVGADELPGLIDEEDAYEEDTWPEWDGIDEDDGITDIASLDDGENGAEAM
jgi:hypothetical protein